MAGFLRPSDLHRVDLDQTTVSPDGLLKLIIVVPKEKRSGSRYTKSITIQPHNDHQLCPVAAFQAYCHRFASAPARHPHPALPDITINYLIRSSQSASPASVGTVGRHIKETMLHIKRPPHAPVPKARALASTLVAKAGLRIDDIVAHGSWSSAAMFAHFYRINSDTHTDSTNATLDQQPRSQSRQCNIM